MIWEASGSPAPKWELEPVDGLCSTCGKSITTGVTRTRIESETYSQHADYRKYGDYDCKACAWMSSYPKPNHRSVIVAGDSIWWPVLGVDSVTEDRPHWRDILSIIEALPGDTLVTGCITTDPKPRLWPRFKVATVSDFGLYIHATDYDVSGFRYFNLREANRVSGIIEDSLQAGFTKRSVFLNLLTDYKHASNSADETMERERRLQELRMMPEFIPALLVAKNIKRSKQANGGNIEKTGASRTIGGETNQNMPRLL
jgi:hypothetical protein